jgi:hypothetical protein
MAVLGFAASVPLWLVWDVGNVEHTVVAVPFLAVPVGLGAESLPARGGELALGAAVMLLGVTNAVVHRLVPLRRERLEPAGGVITRPFLLTKARLASPPAELRQTTRLPAKLLGVAY